MENKPVRIKCSVNPKYCRDTYSVDKICNYDIDISEQDDFTCKNNNMVNNLSVVLDSIRLFNYAMFISELGYISDMFDKTFSSYMYNISMYTDLTEKFIGNIKGSASADILTKLKKSYSEYYLLTALGWKCNQDTYEKLDNILSTSKLLLELRNSLCIDRDILLDCVAKHKVLVEQYNIKNMCMAVGLNVDDNFNENANIYISKLRSEGLLVEASNFINIANAYNRLYEVTRLCDSIVTEIEKPINFKSTTLTITLNASVYKPNKVNDVVIVLDEVRMRKLLTHIKYNLTDKQSSQLERAKMNSSMRESIKVRDNFTCQICGNSVYNEPNLLLEIDHIIPVSRGGKTEPSNLQTLCWKCNRSKSSKIL